MTTNTIGPCPICGRALIEGPSINKHHIVPKTFGGREAFWIHRVCHSKIHSLFSERQLLQVFNTFEALRDNAEIQKFVKWVRKKDPQFVTKNRASAERRNTARR